MKAARTTLAIASVLSAAAMLAGSWAPFQFQEAEFGEVWETFLAAGINLRWGRGDLVANVLLSVPFAFAFLGFLQVGRRRSLATVVLTTFIAIFVAIGISLACELGQGWLTNRVPSLRDFVAQFVGTLIGCTVWSVFGGRFARLVDQLFSNTQTHARAQAAVTLAALGVLIWSVLPLDFMTSPRDLGRKWAEGRIELVPFTRGEASFGDALYQWLASTCLAIPLGLWLVLFAQRILRQKLELTGWLLLAVVTGVMPELLQIPVRSRVASATDALFGILGVAIGIWMGRRIWREDESNAESLRQNLLRQPASWFLAGGMYAIVLALLSWYPFEFVTGLDQMRASLRQFAGNPFSDYQGSNLKTLFVFTRLAVLSGLLGSLLGIGTALIRPGPFRIATVWLMVPICVAVSLALELGQLFETSHSGAGLGFTFRCVATLIGLAAGFFFCRDWSSDQNADHLAASAAECKRSAPSTTDNEETPGHQLAKGTRGPRIGRGFYVPGIDGLRALACLAVFGVHWQQMTGVGSKWGPFDFGQLLENGNTGVAMFMILSGFLLALPLFASSMQQRRQFRLKDYWARRAVRILPAYYLCLAAIVIISSQWRSIGRMADVLLHAVFLHNMTRPTLYSLNPPFWALAPIVQFYALFALLVIALKRFNLLSDRSIVISSVVIAASGQLLATVLTMAEPTSPAATNWIGRESVLLQHSLLAHVSIFVFGMLAARLHLRLGDADGPWADLTLAFSAIACFWVLATPIDGAFQIPGGRYNFPFVPLLLTAVVLAAPRAPMLGPILEAYPIRRLGVISYGFYLFHLPIMKVVKAISGASWVGGHPFLFAVVSISIAIVVSEISYRLLEQPIARMAPRLRFRTPHASSSFSG